MKFNFNVTLYNNNIIVWWKLKRKRRPYELIPNTEKSIRLYDHQIKTDKGSQTLLNMINNSSKIKWVSKFTKEVNTYNNRILLRSTSKRNILRIILGYWNGIELIENRLFIINSGMLSNMKKYNGGISFSKENFVKYLMYILIKSGGTFVELNSIKYKKKNRIHYKCFYTPDKIQKVFVFTRLPKKIKCDDDEWNSDFFTHTCKYGKIKPNTNYCEKITIINYTTRLSKFSKYDVIFPNITNVRSKIVDKYAIDVDKYQSIITINRPRLSSYLLSYFDSLPDSIRNLYCSDITDIIGLNIRPYNVVSLINVERKEVMDYFLDCIELSNYISFKDTIKKYNNLENLINDFNHYWEGWDDGVEIK